MNKIQNVILVVVLGILIAGCASTGFNFDESKISQIKKGETTEPELIQWFGQPVERGINSEGMTTMTWMYTEATVKGSTFVPYVGPFVGGTRSKNKVLMVTLNSGKVANFSFSGGGTETRQTTQGVPKK